jgi:hypothetical protein
MEPGKGRICQRRLLRKDGNESESDPSHASSGLDECDTGLQDPRDGRSLDDDEQSARSETALLRIYSQHAERSLFLYGAASQLLAQTCGPAIDKDRRSYRKRDHEDVMLAGK